MLYIAKKKGLEYVCVTNQISLSVVQVIFSHLDTVTFSLISYCKSLKLSQADAIIFVKKKYELNT